MPHNFTYNASMDRRRKNTQHTTPDTERVVDAAAARPLPSAGLPPPLRRRVAEAIANRYAENTRIAYRRAWSAFAAWAEQRGTQPFPAPAEVVAAYLAERAGRCAISTVQIDRAAIQEVHRLLGAHANPCLDPVVVATMAGLRRMRAEATQRQAQALTDEVLAAIRASAGAPRPGRGGRLERPETARRRAAFDIALCRTMRDAGLRLSEASALRWSDLVRDSDGTTTLIVRRSKTDQTGEGQAVVITGQTAEDLRAWRALSPSAAPEDRVFGRSRSQLYRRIKRAVAAAGYPASGFSGHSGRVGLARKMAARAAPTEQIMRQGRWKSAGMVARYTRRAQAKRALPWLAD